MEVRKKKLNLLLLEVPNSELKALISKSEEFLSYYSKGENNDFELDDSEHSQDSVSTTDYSTCEYLYKRIVCAMKNKRRYKNKPQLIKWVAVCLLVMMGLVLSVLIADCAVYATYQKRSNNIVLVFDKILKVISPLYALLNAARQYVWDPEVRLRGMLAHDYILYLIRNSNDLSLIHICRCRRYAVCRSRWSPYH
eukprot:TRINITY_DN16989_c0_g1_i2.p1 TRINITY_DN16989_c0_g1~~TRINITY_DN16989_c0_g1_i2.p1  ORF type:complete len:195 (+),score=45.13 TRINITY_DN16989_c0_g1_i2:234-818(+)